MIPIARNFVNWELACSFFHDARSQLLSRLPPSARFFVRHDLDPGQAETFAHHNQLLELTVLWGELASFRLARIVHSRPAGLICSAVPVLTLDAVLICQ